MKLTIRKIDGHVVLCKKGSGEALYVIGRTDIACDGLIAGHESLAINDNNLKHIYANYNLKHALNKVARYLDNGISLELALFEFKKLFDAPQYVPQCV